MRIPKKGGIHLRNVRRMRGYKERIDMRIPKGVDEISIIEDHNGRIIIWIGCGIKQIVMR